MPAVDWSQAVTIAWGVFIGLMVFAAIAGSLYAAVALASSAMSEGDISAGLVMGAFVWIISLPVCLAIGAVVVGIAYGLSLALQALFSVVSP